MEEIRIDLTKQSPEEIQKAKDLEILIFKYNHAMPFTTEYNELMQKLFEGKLGKNSVVKAPVSGTRFSNVTIGDNVYVNSGCLIMGGGGITIDDNTMIAANVQLISNNHDLKQRQIITCKPVHIKKNAWIGAGATILPGVTIGENSVVGAGSVVTKNVEDNVVVAGNPAKIIKRIEN
ncbi:bacterial transferase hexapeptide repeat protein [Neocallimastix lanati (nom. inval.)]|uniref:Bacterial transferase hexapeptide repeat protein n=1 Tax=Neocallimastix californiae TaxID=1754190 RepID=A0A1Y2EG78_9FUNG|nr:bacterial transferase hexapeptide repeat protein [Neocallimastix sp. JGI-2020a]ORY70579.1 bacterial transferase hexapeptide repeat protein [Neocallimastix californiae]|eukprot:ORY70579.1 bacterial transferase hexapeptide repeat protein [Neocallimastix californiae]